MIQTPTAIGLWICERVIVEAGTQNPSLISSFSGRKFERFPTDAIPISVFCAMTDSEGVGRIELQVSTADSEEVIYTVAGQIAFPDRFATVHASFRLRDLSFPLPGVYAFDLFVNGEPVAQRRLRVY